MQHSLNKGELYSAYRCLNQISKQKSKADRALCQHGTGRHTVLQLKDALSSGIAHTFVSQHLGPNLTWHFVQRPSQAGSADQDLHTQLPSKQSWPHNLSQSSLKQGCVLAPNMCNIKLDTTVLQLLPKLQHFGVIIAYKLDGQLMHSHKPTHEELMWVLVYAPDILLVNMQPDHSNFS